MSFSTQINTLEFYLCLENSVLAFGQIIIMSIILYYYSMSWFFLFDLSILFTITLREEPSQINVILQQKLLAAKLITVCIVYKQ